MKRPTITKRGSKAGERAVVNVFVHAGRDRESGSHGTIGRMKKETGREGGPTMSNGKSATAENDLS